MQDAKTIVSRSPPNTNVTTKPKATELVDTRRYLFMKRSVGQPSVILILRKQLKHVKDYKGQGYRDLEFKKVSAL